jgi:HlyD family secretion protein
LLRVLSPPVTPTKSAAWRQAAIRGRWIPVILLIVATGIGVAWWSTHRTSPPHYVTVPAARGPITRTVTATGTVNPVLTIIVGTYVSGVIQNLYCDYNTQVRAGQVCAKIDPRPYQATLDQYSGQLLRDQAVRDKDRTDLARYQLLAQQNSIARQQAEDQVYVVNQDEATVKLDEALVEGAKLNLNYTDIISPVDGTVVSRNVSGGQTVAASFQTPTLFLIAADLKKMEVDTNTSEADMGGVKEGDKAIFTVDAFPQRIFRGSVAQIRTSPQTVQNVVTYDVVVGVDNSDLALMPGMTASTQIIVDQRDDVLRVPNQALRYVPGGLSAVQARNVAASKIWVLRDGEPVAVSIVPGLSDDNFTEIVKGDLHPGDQIITGETRGSASGQPVLPPPRS